MPPTIRTVESDLSSPVQSPGHVRVSPSNPGLFIDSPSGRCRGLGAKAPLPAPTARSSRARRPVNFGPSRAGREFDEANQQSPKSAENEHRTPAAGWNGHPTVVTLTCGVRPGDRFACLFRDREAGEEV